MVLRGGLALYVVLYHFLTSFPALQEKVRSYTLLFSHGSFAVDCFFVLSGFVMMYVYGDRFSGGLKKTDLSEFFIARFARLYPVQIFTFLVLLCWYLLTSGRRGDWGPFLNSDGRYCGRRRLPTFYSFKGRGLTIEHGTTHHGLAAGKCTLTSCFH